MPLPPEPDRRWLRRLLPGGVDSPGDPLRRRQARLLGAFLLVAIVVFALVDSVYVSTVPGYLPPWYGYAFLIGAWLLNQRGHYRAAASVTLAMFPLVIFTLVVSRSSAEPQITLCYLVLGILLASILLSWRGVIVFTLVSLGGLALMPLVAPAAVASWSAIVGPFSVTILVAALALVFMRHRDLVERDRQAELRSKEQRLRLALDAGRMGAWEWEIETGAVRWSEQIDAIFGVAPKSFDGTYEGYMALVHPDDRPVVERSIRAALSGPSGEYEVRHRIASPDGRERWIEAYGRLDRDPAGRPLRLMGTVFEITERRRAEAERESLIHELEVKNAELERFTYTVSHDLKSPLVTIRGFLTYVAEHAAAGRMASLRQDLGRIVGATDRMHQLLDELLHLSRVGRVGNPPGDVDLATVAEEVVSLARTRLDERGIRVEIAPDLPVVHADRLRLLELFQNLVDNSIRFMGEETHPLICVGWRGGDSSPVVFVQDNGIGIDPAHHERVFGLFDKLDPRTEGTGVGLALARRIVETHGGRIWIESEGGDRGTAVCFTLPAVSRAPEAAPPSS